MQFRRRLCALLLMAACGGGPARLYVDRARGMDGGWRLEESPVRLDATGDVATLDFAGRTFVFHGLGEFEGHLSEEQVYLRGDRLRIVVTPEALRVEERAGRPGGEPVHRRWPLAEVPEGSRVVYDGGELRW